MAVYGVIFRKKSTLLYKLHTTFLLSMVWHSGLVAHLVSRTRARSRVLWGCVFSNVGSRFVGRIYLEHFGYPIVRVVLRHLGSALFMFQYVFSYCNKTLSVKLRSFCVQHVLHLGGSSHTAISNNSEAVYTCARTDIKRKLFLNFKFNDLTLPFK